MHEKAKQALAARIDDFVNGCILTKTILFDPESWGKVAGIAKQAAKLKGEWLDERDFYALIYLQFHNLLPNLVALEGELRNFIEPAKISEAILDEVIGIPYRYNIYYEFPELSLSNDIVSEFDERTSFRRLSSDFVKGVRSTLLGGETPDSSSFYFSVFIEGYIGVSEDSATLHGAHGLLKVFLERSFSSMILLKSGAPTISNEVGAMFIHLVGAEGELKKRMSLKLPKDLTHVLGGVGAIGEMNDISQEEFDGKLTGLRKLLLSSGALAKKLMVASEWCFDSDAEAVPAMSVVKVCIGLESIFGDDASEGGITRSLSDRCAYSLAMNNAERDSLVSDCRELYKVRSKVVHGVRARLTVEEQQLLFKGRKILERSITKEIGMI